jgi:hypothetical protein
MKADQGQQAFESGMVDVDIQGLDDFRDLLRSELDANFKPVTERVIMEHRAGVTFGARNASGEMQAVRLTYAHCLGRAMQNLAAYVEASEILIAAAARIAGSYRRTDELAAANIRTIESALKSAVATCHDARIRMEDSQRAEYEHRTALLEGLA